LFFFHFYLHSFSLGHFNLLPISPPPFKKHKKILCEISFKKKKKRFGILYVHSLGDIDYCPQIN